MSAGISQPPPIEVATPLRAGERTDPSGRPIKNHILLSIPDEEYNLLRPHLEFVDLENHLVLQEQEVELSTVTSSIKAWSH
jgi:hypothetical protein